MQFKRFGERWLSLETSREWYGKLVGRGPTMKGPCKNPYLYIWMWEFRLWTIAPDLFSFTLNIIVYLPLCYPPFFHIRVRGFGWKYLAIKHFKLGSKPWISPWLSKTISPTPFVNKTWTRGPAFNSPRGRCTSSAISAVSKSPNWSNPLYCNATEKDG